MPLLLTVLAAALCSRAQVLDSENLMTVFVVVSKFGVKDWEATYENLCDFVVSCPAALQHR